MNIPVLTHNGHVMVRPDTTIDKFNRDFYPPEFVNTLSYTPVLFARICKAGRSVGAEFADRYYDAYNYGVLLYADDLAPRSSEGFASASCLDHTSFLPFPLYGKITLEHKENEFKLRRGGRVIFRHSDAQASMIEEAICEISKYVYLRSGDLIAIELAGRKKIFRPKDKTVRISGSYCGNGTIDFEIKK